jgi:acyl-CoA hydrolase
VFVGIDEKGRPQALPPLIVETDEERRRMRAAEQRRTARLARPST